MDRTNFSIGEALLGLQFRLQKFHVVRLLEDIWLYSIEQAI